MELKKIINGNKATVELEGRIDAKIAPELEKELLALPAEIKALDLDFKNVSYISSAGLRVMVSVDHVFENRNGSLKIVGVTDEVMEIFEITGFTEFFTIDNRD